LRILHDQPYSHTNTLGDSLHIQQYKAITQWVKYSHSQRNLVDNPPSRLH
jgi:hypothetical protein